VGSVVEWSIRAPNQAQSVRNVYVTFDTIPREKNSGNFAAVEEQTVSVEVVTLLTSLTTTLSISSPLGAVDGRLSSSQSFVVKATIEWNNVKNITAQISLPSGYSTDDNMVKSVISPEVLWQVDAPGMATGLDFIQVSTGGYDALSDEPVEADLARLFVTTVSRADLSLNLSTSDNSVSLGQEFVVSALVENKGEADTVGVTRVSLDPLPSGYSTDEPLTKSLKDGMTSWTIRAPIQPTREAVNIKASLTTIPLDENTDEPAYVSRHSDGVAVTTVGAWLSVSEYSGPDTVSGLVVPGQRDVWLMALELVNRGETGANGIVVHSMSFDVEDFGGNEIHPDDALSEIRAVRLVKTVDTTYVDTTQIFGRVTQAHFPDENPLIIPFDSQETIQATDTSIIVILGNISETGHVSYFQLNLPNGSYINARDEYSDSLTVSVLTVAGQEIENLRSDPKQIVSEENVQEDAEPYLLNCPNPFGRPESVETTIVYYLKKNADVTFRIYTLTGKLVWSRSFTSSDPQGSEGLHSLGRTPVTWDGRNDGGRKVLNGVYILVMETGYGEVAKTKIAVVK